MEGGFLTAFLLTLFAGLSTGVGSIIGFVADRNKKSILSLGLGFSAGVMIYVSFMELMFHSMHVLEDIVPDKTAALIRMAAFFGGIILAAFIDMIIPDHSNPHDCGQEYPSGLEDCKDKKVTDKIAASRLARMGAFTAVAIAVHNFPEGFAVFASALKEPALGVSIAIAIAIHNIPEGIAVSIPVYYASGSRKKAFAYSFLSGLAEPLGAVAGYLVLRPFLNDFVFAIVFGAVAGIMIYISFDELLPAARRYGKSHTVITGLVLGMLVMAFGLDFIGHSH